MIRVCSASWSSRWSSEKAGPAGGDGSTNDEEAPRSTCGAEPGVALAAPAGVAAGAESSSSPGGDGGALGTGGYLPPGLAKLESLRLTPPRLESVVTLSFGTFGSLVNRLCTFGFTSRAR